MTLSKADKMTSTIIWQHDCPGHIETRFVDGEVHVACYIEEGPPPPARVTEGLLVLYPFDEREGLTVHDRSGVGAPLDLTIGNESAASWIPEGGLSIDSPTVLLSSDAATKVTEAVRLSNEITIEAWLRPASTTQDGPARILALSADVHNANFQLSQACELFDLRLRTTETTGNGRPSLSTPLGSLTADLTHFVYTRDAAGMARAYINGEVMVGKAVGGDLSNWDGLYRLAMANDVAETRSWLGEYYLISLYDRALSADEIKQNLEAGVDGVPEPPPQPPPEEAPAITSAAPAMAYVGQAYTYDVEATGNPVPTYSLVTAPAGMTIDASTGLIEWLPSLEQVGSNGVMVVASNGVAPDAVQSFVVEVTDAPPQPPPGEAPTITSTPGTTVSVGQAYTYDVEATGDPEPSYNLTTAPAGMTIDAASGLIAWVPSLEQVGSNGVTVVASNGVAPDAVQSFVVEVAEEPPQPPPPPTGEVIAYGGSHISTESSHYRVKVNGKPVFVHFFEGRNPEAGKSGGFMHYAHFAFGGTANIEIEYKDNISQCRIGPRRLNIVPQVSGRKASFSISEPRKLVVAINVPLSKSDMDMKHHLLLFAEAPETDVPSQSAATTRVVSSAGQAQSAINSCPEGGVVYFPAGTYNLSSSLNITKSNITIYLEGGAFVNHGGSDPFLVNDKRNITIRGRGVIQSFGRTFHPKRIENLFMEGVILRNRRAGKSGQWAFKPGQTNNSIIRNVKVLVAPRLGGRALDGMDPSNSKNLLIEDCFVLSGDDAIVIKTMGAPEKGDHPYSDGPNVEIEDLVVRNCVLFTHASAIKTGSEVYRKIKSLTWENNDVIFGHVIFVSRAKGSNAGANIQIDGVHIDNCPGRILEAGWRSYDLPIRGPVNIEVNDMVIHKVWRGTNCLWVTGDSSSRIKITFNNLKVEGKYIRSRQELEAAGIDVAINAGGGTVDLRFNVT